MRRAAYTKLNCEVTYCETTLRTVPFVIDHKGQPFEALNSYVRGFFDDWNKKAGSVGQTIDRVLSFIHFLGNNQRSWDSPTHDYVSFYIKQLEQESSNDTINAHTNAIYAFYWFCEQKRFCSGLIGITDSNNDDYRYPLHVLDPRSSRRDYDNPHFKRRGHKQLRAGITKNKDWESAYHHALGDATPASLRDAVLMLLILESGARRVEALSLQTDQFKDRVRPDQEYMKLTVNTKRDQTRILCVPRETYLEVKRFIEDERPDLIANRRQDRGYVFSGENGNGHALSDNHVSNRLRHKYGVAPNDGRSTFATNLMIELCRKGCTEESAILLVCERMGHSLTDKTARTLRTHYLQAKAIVEAHESGTELEQAREENANLKATIAERDSKITELQAQLEQLTDVELSAQPSD